MLSLALASLLLSSAPPSTDKDLEVRPWDEVQVSSEEYVRGSVRAKDPASRLELARWCLTQGLFVEAQELLAELAAKDTERGSLAALAGLEAHEDGLRPEEVARFTDQSPRWSLPTLQPDRHKKLLSDIDRDIELAHTGAFFDLWTDLPFDELKDHSKVLNEYHRNLKTRLRAYSSEKIDILLFARKSDFLHFYERWTGEAGLHVDGFFVPSTRNLVFYDKPYDRAEAFNTARHECTHLLINLSYGGSGVPPWLNEGLACYLAADGEAAEGRYTTSLLLRTRALLQAKEAPTLRALMDLDGANFQFDQYAIAWSWMHFLNSEAHRARFQRFLVNLRKEVREMNEARKGGEPPSAAAYRARAQAIFESTFGDDSWELQREWQRFFEKEFALRSTTQLMDYAWGSVSSARRLSAEGGRDRAIDEVLFALESLPQDCAERTSGQAALARASGLLLRLAGLDSDLAAQRLALRTLLESLREVPDGADDALRGEVALRTLYALRQAMDAANDSGAPRDFRKLLVEPLTDLPPADQDLGRARVVLFDELVEVARNSFATALDSDPLNRRAAHQALFLAMDFAPSGLESVFDRLRLLVEHDPDDSNLAALAVTYAALGNSGWAKHLLEQARACSANPAQLEVYEAYIVN